MNVTLFNSEWVSKQLFSTPPPQGAAHAFNSICTDSRNINPGALFVALRGDTFDGHTFIEEVIQKGATGLLVSPSPQASNLKAKFPLLSWFEVDDTQAAFRKLAAAWAAQIRAKTKLPIFAIGGSEGKTTTKELLASILSGKFKHVLKTEKSQNGFLGIAITLFELREHHDAAVIEIGIDEIGAMRQHAELVAPDFATLTSIGPEHLERLKSVETVAYEEGLLFEITLARGGKIAVNQDDPWIAAWEKKGTPFSLKGFSPENYPFSCPLPGPHNRQNLANAITLARLAGMNDIQIQKGLGSFKGAPGRSEVRTLSPQISVVCDFYNANPTSMHAAFGLITELKTPGTEVLLCLADMLELGPNEEQFHRGLAPELKTIHPQFVFLFGRRMKWLHETLQKEGVQTHHFETKAEMATALRKNLSENNENSKKSLVLLKGSRGMKMETLWEDLSARPE